MRIYPPNIRIGYKGNVCEKVKSTIHHLKKECYQTFVDEIERYRKDYSAQVYVKEGVYKGNLLRANTKGIALVTDDQTKINVDLEQIHYIQFDQDKRK